MCSEKIGGATKKIQGPYPVIPYTMEVGYATGLSGNIQMPQFDARLRRGPGFSENIPKSLAARNSRLAKGPSKVDKKVENGQPQQESDFVKNLLKNKWSDALLAKIPSMTAKVEPDLVDRVINRAFSWKKNIPHDRKVCFARTMERLLDLQIGQDLISKIVELRRFCLEFPSVEFSYVPSSSRSNNQRSKYEYRENSASSCRITINEGEGRDQVLVVHNTGSGQLDFVRVDVPLASILAHELNHHVQAMDTLKRIIEVNEEYSKICSQNLEDAVKNSGNITNGAIAANVYIAVRNAETSSFRCVQVDRDSIVNDIVDLSKVEDINNMRESEKLFLNCWSADYEEILNILPSASILNNSGGFTYSDGAVLYEFLNKFDKSHEEYPEFFKLGTQDRQNIDWSNLTGNSFVRFSHMGADDFYKKYSALKPEEQENFRKLTQGLLDKIKVNGVSLAPQNNNLPEVA